MALEWIRRALSSKIFPYLTAAVMLLCYYTGGDLIALYFLTAATILMLLLLDDLTPFVNSLLFLIVVVSYKNSPSPFAGNSDYYFRPAVLGQLIAMLSLTVIACIYRLATTFAKRKFKPTPVFYTLCALSAAFLLNGLFGSGYRAMDFMYGLAMCFVYLVIFMLLKDNLKPGKDAYEYIAHCFVALSILLVSELALTYLTNPNVLVDGHIDRYYIAFGWGVYNTMGLLLLLSIPSVIYLATLYKRGYLLFIYSLALVCACCLSMSRQAILGAVIVYPICLVMLFMRSKQRLVNGVILGAAALAAMIVAIIFREFLIDTVKNLLHNIFDDVGNLDGGGRMVLYIAALKDFAKSPVFGEGFFSPLLISNFSGNVTGMDFDLHFYHNTVLQMMGACGLVGLICYTVHRVITVLCFCNNVTHERSYIAVSILVILLLSLLDVYMFDVLPTLIYSFLLAVLVASDKKPERKPKIVTITV